MSGHSAIIAFLYLPVLCGLSMDNTYAFTAE